MSIYGQKSCSKSTVEICLRDLRGGRESLEDDERSSRPSTSIYEDTASEVEKTITQDKAHADLLDLEYLHEL